MAFPESNSSGSLQLHSKIYVLVSISDPLLRLPGSVAPGSRDTETSLELRVLGAFPRGSLPPSHKPTAPDKPQPKQCPEPRGLVALCLLDPPWDRQGGGCQLGFSKIVNFPLTLPLHSSADVR